MSTSRPEWEVPDQPAPRSILKAAEHALDNSLPDELPSQAHKMWDADDVVWIVLEAAAPMIRAAERDSIAHEIDRAMNTQRPKGCGCPAGDQRLCGWRDGMGTAADIARETGNRGGVQ